MALASFIEDIPFGGISCIYLLHVSFMNDIYMLFTVKMVHGLSVVSVLLKSFEKKTTKTTTGCLIAKLISYHKSH